MTGSKIAFYAPLKSPDHEVPSGDRLMARSLVSCLQAFGCDVIIASHLRVFVRDPNDDVTNNKILEDAALEAKRISLQWGQDGPPDCWFCYHPYYKSPDLIGPALCKTFDVPYITAEASYSERRNEGFWGLAQERVLHAVNGAAINLYFTQRDMIGLREGGETAKLAQLRPFIRPLEYVAGVSNRKPLNLLTVAMMRPGDKWNSYVHLAAALSTISDRPWTLHIVGNGPKNSEVRALFGTLPSECIVWHGEKTSQEIAAIYASSALYVWPGCGEAYGLAYLEAQSAGLPVIAFNTAGVPEVVDNEYSGILTEEGNDDDFGSAIARLLSNDEERDRMAINARQHILDKHTFKQASELLENILSRVIGSKYE